MSASISIKLKSPSKSKVKVKEEEEGTEAASASTAASWKPRFPTWRDHSSAARVEAHAAKFHLHPPSEMPKDFRHTEEERRLLEMYDTVKIFEREVLRLKEKKAREHIFAAMESKAGDSDDENENGNGDEANDDDAANAKIKSDPDSMAPASARKKPKAKKKKKKPKKIDVDPSAMDSSDEEDDDDGDDDRVDASSDEDEDELRALRDEVDQKKLNEAKERDAKAREERLRKELLQTAGDDDLDHQPMLKRKKLNNDNDPSNLSPSRAGEGPSLLSKMMTAQTPPHEFSEKLEIKPWKGTVLLPSPDSDEQTWTPPDYKPRNANDGAFMVELDGFDISKANNGEGPNTLAIKFHAPSKSRRFSFNIAGPNHNDFDSILFHFNPRQREKGGQLVVNDKQAGVWGRAVQLPLSQVPLMFGQTSSTLLVQINGDGFDVFVEGKHVARLEHRVELPSRPCKLVLQFPSCDDYRSPENWVVYKAWWGNKEILHQEDVSNVAGVNAYDSVHPKKLFISGLRKIKTDQQVDIRRAELERVFRKYGGARGVACIVPKHSSYAFVEFETEHMCDVAMQQMPGSSFPYKINRARRTKHEALMEERAAKERGGGTARDGGDW